LHLQTPYKGQIPDEDESEIRENPGTVLFPQEKGWEQIWTGRTDSSL
jgi:hypothetical protein